MPIQKDVNNVIQYTKRKDTWEADLTGVVAGSQFSVAGDADVLKQIGFDPNTLPTNTVITVNGNPSTSGNITVTLPATSGTISVVGGSVEQIGTIDSQPRTADGATAIGAFLYLQTADATHPGLAPNIGAANGVASLDSNGLVPLAQIPPAALERLVIVANQAARFALTTATVQNGDTVRQTDVNEMFFVVDQNNLGNAAGYLVYSAGTAAAVAWTGITGVPAPVSALSGTNTGDVSIAAVGSSPSANGASLSGQVLTLQPADATHPGVVTAADWSTFNSKQNAITTLPTGQGGTGTSTTFTVGSVVFADSSGNYSQDNTNFNWDATNHRLNLGGHLSTAALGIASSGTQVALDIASTGSNTALNLQNQGAQFVAQFTNSTNSATQGAAFGGAFSRGTTGAKTAVQAGDQVATWSGQSYNGASFGPGYNAALAIVATENQTATHNGGELVIATTPNGSLAPVSALIMGPSQLMQLPAYTTAGVLVNDASGNITASAQLAIAKGGTGSATTSQNFAFIGPTSGSGAPSFRALVSGDIPSLSATYLPLAGGTMSGAINLGSHQINSVTDPTSAQDAATKNYVDTALAALNPADACYAATTGSNIAGTYLNGVSGVGATFTVTATGAFSLDGTTPPVNSRILIKDQSSGFQNGVYSLTVAGTTGVSPVLTRALDYNTAADMNGAGLIPIQNGTVNALSSWQQIAVITTVGSDSLVFSEFTANPSLYVLKANNLSDVASKSTAFNNLSPMTTGGDLIYGGASGSGTRLANGSSGQVLTSAGGTSAPTWVTPNAGTVTAVSVASSNGFTGSSSGGATPAITIATSVTGVIKGNGTAVSAAVSGTDYSAGTSALSTGILKSTTSTGALTIAVAGDFPTLNQNTSGSAASLSATLAIGSGGTGQTTQTAAFDALQPMTTGGDIIYGGASGTGTRLANGSSGNVLTSNGGTSAPSWQAPGAATIKMAIISEQQTSGTNGGTATNGVQTRTLNTLVDPNSIVTSLSTNQFTLPAGTYYIDGAAPARSAGVHRAWVKNVTDSTVAIVGQSSQTVTGTAVATSGIFKGIVTIAGSKAFNIQHYVGTTEAVDGLGQAVSDGTNGEVYTLLMITKIA